VHLLTLFVSSVTSSQCINFFLELKRSSLQKRVRKFTPECIYRITSTANSMRLSWSNFAPSCKIAHFKIVFHFLPCSETVYLSKKRENIHTNIFLKIDTGSVSSKHTSLLYQFIKYSFKRFIVL
jgi:hypothetical protein